MGIKAPHTGLQRLAVNIKDAEQDAHDDGDEGKEGGGHGGAGCCEFLARIRGSDPPCHPIELHLSCYLARLLAASLRVSQGNLRCFRPFYVRLLRFLAGVNKLTLSTRTGFKCCSKFPKIRLLRFFSTARCGVTAGEAMRKYQLRGRCCATIGCTLIVFYALPPKCTHLKCCPKQSIGCYYNFNAMNI